MFCAPYNAVYMKWLTVQVIAACAEYGMTMAFTNLRLFHHWNKMLLGALNFMEILEYFITELIGILRRILLFGVVDI